VLAGTKKEGKGNFSGAAVMMFAETLEYICVSGRGNVEDYTEFMCSTFGNRAVGAMWRVGGAAAGDEVRGHWVGISYAHNPSLPFGRRHWYFKDSMATQVETINSMVALEKLRVPDQGGCDWFLIMDCH